MTQTDEMAARYGVSSAHRTRIRWIVIVAALLMLGAFGVWAGLSAVSTSANSVSASDVGFDIASSRSVTVTFSVSVPRHTDVTCAVQALDSSYAVIGYRLVDLPGVDHRTTTYTETVRTVEPASSGSLDRCWPAQSRT